MIRQDWSPEQISGWLGSNFELRASHEWIYQYILADKRAGEDLYRYRKRYGSHDKRGKWLNRVSIDERPDIVITRQRPGDWEVDTIIGKGRLQVVVLPIASHPNDC